MKLYEKKDFLILFNGDSITHGGRRQSMDCNHILGHGYAEMLSAEIGFAHIKKTPRFVNRGVAGQKLFHMVEKWENDVYTLSPDLISILIGANDAGVLADAAGWEKMYRDLLAQTREKFPNIPLVLVEPFFFPMLPGEGSPYEKVPHPICEPDFLWPARNATTEHNARRMADIEKMQEIVKGLAVSFGAVFVPLQSVFEEYAKTIPLSYLVWDGVHPTTIGHKIIKDEWLRAAGHLVGML